MLDHIELQGDLTEEQRARLLDIASQCPVHRTLTSEIEIRTRLVPPRIRGCCSLFRRVATRRFTVRSCPPGHRESALGAPPYLVALVLASVGCDGPAALPAPTEVAVAHPVVRELVDWDEYTGQVEAVERVEVRARVSGYLESTHFREGEVVKKGQLLFVIDPRPFRAAVEQTRGELLRAEAELHRSRLDVQRYEPLVREGAVSRQERDNAVQGLRADEAAVQAARAAVEKDEIDLGFTEIRSPIDGRVGRNLVDAGNLISGGTPQSTLLTTVVSLDPVHIYFEADERSYLKYTRLSQSGRRPSSREFRNPVQVAVADESDFPHPGYMDFVDNEIDPSTGTIRARAVVPNPGGLLTPGLFARVRLLGSGRYQALLIPDEVIGADQSQRYVLVVGEDDVLEARTVETGPGVAGLRVVRQGLAPDDRVVLSGLHRIRAGARVAPRLTELATPERIEELEPFTASPPPQVASPASAPSEMAFPAPPPAPDGPEAVSAGDIP